MSFRPLDIDRFLVRLRDAARVWRADAAVSGWRQMHGGASGLTFACVLSSVAGEVPVVVKVAPAGLEPVRNRDVLRQAAVQAGLAGVAGVPVPEIVFSQPGSSLDDPPFYVMRRAAGECFEPLLDLAEPSADVAVFNARARALVEAMVSLHAVSVARVRSFAPSLEQVSLVDEIGTWQRAFCSVGAGDLGAVEVDHSGLVGQVGQGLLDRLPREPVGGPCLVHGDLRLGNALFTDTTLSAIIDWEICRLGHPLLDLAWMCSFVDPLSLVTRARDLEGLVKPAELADLYAQRSGMSVEQLNWFTALMCFKQAAVTALIVKNQLRRADPDPHLVGLGPMVAAYLRRALELLTTASPASSLSSSV